MNRLSVEKLINDIESLKLINNINCKEKFIEIPEISRPGLELTGRFEHFAPKRLQLFGTHEATFVNDFVDEEILKKFLSEDIPVVIFSRNQIPTDIFLNIARKKNIPVVKTNKTTSKIFSEIYAYLEYNLAPETSLHGVMLSIYGVGVLIKGSSGIGKSEVALELIKQGHFLIADDNVIIKEIDNDSLICSAPSILKNKMEIRGIGIVDIQKLYGVTSVLLEKELDLIIELANDEENIDVDRLGNSYLTEKILNSVKKKIRIPVLKGKNISSLIEVAVANYQLKSDYNYDASKEFIENLEQVLINKNKYCKK